MTRRIPPGAPIVTAAAVRAAEQQAFDAGTSQDVLMERAGTAVAQQVARLAAGRSILVLAGPGNNGGDAYVVARHLQARGLDVCVAALGEPKAGAAARMAQLWTGPTTDLHHARPRPVVVDGLLGIGRPRPFDQDVELQLGELTGVADLRIAIDLPSGLDADTGEGGRSADVTIVIGALKPGHVLAAGNDSGHLLVADIGLSLSSRWRTAVQPRIARLSYDTNKFTRGTVVVVGGTMPGAGRLAGSAALNAGAGYVMLSSDQGAGGSPHALVHHRIQNAEALRQLLADDRIDVVVMGPGLGRDRRATELLDVAVKSSHDLVIDGDALTLLGRQVSTGIQADRRQVCLTPHGGEFARMFDSFGSKIEATLAAAAASGAVVVHKGADTVIAHPDGSAVVCADAPASLATAGSGDVLAGLIAARRASGLSMMEAAEQAVWLHARAAELTGAVYAADALVARIPKTIAQCPTI